MINFEKTNKMEFTKEDLIVGETVLIGKQTKSKCLYLGNCGLVHFVSSWNDYTTANNNNFTIEDLNIHFTIEKEEDLTVILEQKVYDFVDVEVRDDNISCFSDYKLLAVVPNSEYPYKVVDIDGGTTEFRYAKFKR